MTDLGMAISASFADSGVRSGEIDRRARRRAFDAALRHSRLVRVLRIALPATGILAIAGLVTAATLSLPGELDLSAASLSVTKNAIIMENPNLRGFDGERRQYSLSADRAIQALASPDEVRLEAIAAKIVAAGQGATIIAADAGDYDHGDSTLRLIGAISIDSAEGYSLRMTDADIDFSAETLVSENPVTVTYKGSEISAARFSVTDGGKIILFEGDVRTSLLPPKRDQSAVATE
jgi:lipopolysaccharide export system protein LptC